VKLELPTDNCRTDRQLRSLFGISRLLILLEVAGFKQRGITHLAYMMGRVPGKYVIRMAVVSLTIDYLILVPMRHCDENLKALK
jgi:hypothetical protein